MDHMVYLLLIFWGSSIQFSLVAIGYTLVNVGYTFSPTMPKGYHFLLPLPVLVIFWCGDSSHPFGCKVLSCFDSCFLSDEWLHRWHNGKDSAYQCRRHKRCGLDPWVGKIPRRRKWQPTPVFLPAKSHRQRILAGYSQWSCKESDTTEYRCMVQWLMMLNIFSCVYWRFVDSFWSKIVLHNSVLSHLFSKEDSSVLLNTYMLVGWLLQTI